MKKAKFRFARRLDCRVRVACARVSSGRYSSRCRERRCSRSRLNRCRPRSCAARASRNLFIFKRDAFGRPLPGAVFALRNSCGHALCTVVSNKAGVAVLRRLPPGSYTVREEQSPEGFCPTQRVQRIDVLRNGRVRINGCFRRIARILFINTPKRAGFSFLRYDALGMPLGGAVFELVSQLIGSMSLTAISAEGSGRVSFPEVLPGEYLLRELSVPAPHLSSGMVFPVVVCSDGSITVSGIPAAAFFNLAVFNSTLEQTTISLADQNDPLFFSIVNELGQPLEGIQFDVVNEMGAVVASGISNTQGRFSFSELPHGSFVLQERSSTIGIPLRLAVQVQVNGTILINGLPANLFQGTAFVLLSSLQSNFLFNFSFYKADLQNAPLAGVFFILQDYLGRSIAEAQSDSSGLVAFTALPSGSYLLREYIAPLGCVADPTPYPVEIAPDGIIFISGILARDFAARTMVNCHCNGIALLGNNLAFG